MRAKARPRRGVFAADGRAVIVAMDHGAFGAGGPADPRAVIAAAAEGGGDAILVSAEIAHALPPAAALLDVVLRLDGLDAGGAVRLQHSVEEALAVGARGVGVMGVGGAGDQALALLRQECVRLGVLLMVEIPGEDWDPRRLAAAVSANADRGADFVKLPFVEPVSAFADIVRRCPVPAVVLGGARLADEALLERVAAACAAGAAGVAIGRNVWQHVRPARMVQALAAIVHDGAGIGAALHMLAGEPS